VPATAKSDDGHVGGVRVVHRSGGKRRVLATEVELADGFLSRARGLMFRRSIPEGYAMWFRFDRPERRSLHMLFVPFAIDAVWLVDDEVTTVRRLPAWRGLGRGTADAVLELPAGAAADVEPGDRVVVEEAATGEDGDGDGDGGDRESDVDGDGGDRESDVDGDGGTDADAGTD
jgi:hypothetical protein